jgi:hypothetical protein
MSKYRWWGAALLITVLIPGGRGLAQSPFMNLTPGVSVRAEVARVLGNPLRPTPKGALEYPPPDGLAGVEVYFDNKGIVQRIDVFLEQPVTRRALAARFGLPERESAEKAAGGKRIEYYAGPLLALTYASNNVADGVGVIGHYNRGLFEAESGLRAAPPVNSFTPNRGVRLEGSQLVPPYGVSNAEQCQAACSGRAACKAVTVSEVNARDPHAPVSCHLWSSVTKAVKDPAFSSWVKQ